jgi:hypothetical protein
MFYLENKGRPQGKIVLGTEEFERVIREYVINVYELTTTQYQLFIGTLIALDLYKELIPNYGSGYVARFSPDE